MKHQCITFLLLLAFQACPAQPYEGPDTLWTRMHRFRDLDSFLSTNVVLMPDGGLMISGHYISQGETDAGPCMVRLDSSGNFLWLRPTHDSNNVTIYPNYMSRIEPDLFLLAASIAGNQLDPSVTLCNADGAVLGQRSFAMPDLQWVVGACPSGDGGGMVIYDTDNIYTNSRVMCAMKVDAHGNCTWTYSYPNSGGDASTEAVAPTSDGGYMLIGSSRRWTDAHPLLLIKLDANGEMEFTRSYYFPCDESRADDIAELTDGDFVISGHMQSANITRIFALRINANGDTLWTWFGEPSDGTGVELIAANDGGFIVRSGGYRRFSSSNSLLWQRSYTLAPCYYHNQWESALDQNGRLIAAGEADCPADSFNGRIVAVFRTQPDTIAINASAPAYLPNGFVLSVYPNPFNSTTQIEFTLSGTQHVSLRLYDVLGREVAVLLNAMQTAGEHRMSFNGDGLSSGVYFCRMQAGNEMRTRKIVLMK